MTCSKPSNIGRWTDNCGAEHQVPVRCTPKSSCPIVFARRSYREVMDSKFTGRVYVVRDNIDTDQIIPAQFLNLVPTIDEEYEKLGSYAMYGLPDSLYPVRFIADGAMDTEYSILLAGRNFGCGSSREHAPIALGAAQTQCVVAEGFARIFFRNCVATGEVYPVECLNRLCDIFSTGDIATVDIDQNTITHVASGKVYDLKPLGEVRPVVDAGGIFAYARQTGMIPKAV